MNPRQTTTIRNSNEFIYYSLYSHLPSFHLLDLETTSTKQVLYALTCPQYGQTPSPQIVEVSIWEQSTQRFTLCQFLLCVSQHKKRTAPINTGINPSRIKTRIIILHLLYKAHTQVCLQPLRQNNRR